MRGFFVSDLHGRPERYEALLDAIREDPPDAVFLGGDLLPHAMAPAEAAAVEGGGEGGFVEWLARRFEALGTELCTLSPRIVLILGNDDPRANEALVVEAEERGLWSYAHGRRLALCGHAVYGYACIPPSPFMLKDWERYDVSRYVDPGCVSPEDGHRSVPGPKGDARSATIARDLELLAGKDDLSGAILLCHVPPYRSGLDRAALDGQRVDHVPLDVHIGSIALRRFIDKRQPLLTLHGHVHESVRLTGVWHERIGRTHVIGAAHDGPELALVRFDTRDLNAASRELRPTTGRRAT